MTRGHNKSIETTSFPLLPLNHASQQISVCLAYHLSFPLTMLLSRHICSMFKEFPVKCLTKTQQGENMFHKHTIPIHVFQLNLSSYKNPHEIM